MYCEDDQMKVDEMDWGMCNAWEINVYIVWWENLNERDYLGNLCVYRQIILKWEIASCVHLLPQLSWLWTL
jgi:hypothetical protein